MIQYERMDSEQAWHIYGILIGREPAEKEISNLDVFRALAVVIQETGLEVGALRCTKA